MVVNAFAIDQRSGDTLDVSGVGDETFANGKIASLAVSIKTGKQRGRVILSNGTLYARSSRPANAARPWMKADLTAQGFDPSVRALVVGFETLVIFASPAYISGLRSAASDVRARLPVTAHGVRTTDYAMYVDPTKVRLGQAVLAQLAKPLAMTADVNLDDAGRAIALNEQQNDGATSFASQTTFSNYNAKVTVKVPSANEVAR